MASADTVFVDAGVFIGALLGDDPRHQEARPLVESARCGEISWCTSAGVLAEVYAALTWTGAQPPTSRHRGRGSSIARGGAIRHSSSGYGTCGRIADARFCETVRANRAPRS